MTSVFTNMFSYALIDYLSNKDILSAYFTFCIGLAEGKGRYYLNLNEETKKVKGSFGSIPGKIISLPIEAGLGIYDGIKERNKKTPKNENRDKFKPFIGHGGER